MQRLQVIIIACMGTSSSYGIHLYTWVNKNTTSQIYTYTLHLTRSLIQSMIITHHRSIPDLGVNAFGLSLLCTDKILIYKNTSHRVSET